MHVSAIDVDRYKDYLWLQRAGQPQPILSDGRRVVATQLPFKHEIF